MADCFISYKREDRDRVEPIVDGLRAAGYAVWWDADIEAGSPWRETIAAELDAARCVLVCWTQDAVGPAGTYVREEAERAKHRGVLLPVLLDRVALPFGFGEVQALDLANWNGSHSAPAWHAVLRAVEAILSGGPSTPAPTRRRRWAWLGGAVAAALAGIGLIADVTGLASTVCKPDAALATACRWLGLGPSQQELDVWNAAKASGSSAPLKAYLGSYPNGAFVAEAQARIAACQTTPKVSWVPYAGRTIVVVPSGPLRAAPTEADARQAMLRDVTRAAEDGCSAATLSELYRAVPGARPEIPDGGWKCQQADGRWRCGYDGPIACPQERRQTIAREVCPGG